MCKRYGRYFNAARILRTNVARGGRKPSPNGAGGCNPSPAFLFVSAVAAEEHPEEADDQDEAF